MQRKTDADKGRQKGKQTPKEWKRYGLKQKERCRQRKQDADKDTHADDRDRKADADTDTDTEKRQVQTKGEWRTNADEGRQTAANRKTPTNTCLHSFLSCRQNRVKHLMVKCEMIWMTIGNKYRVLLSLNRLPHLCLTLTGFFCARTCVLYSFFNCAVYVQSLSTNIFSFLFNL